MPSRPIHPLPAPRWTAAHTEGLKGLGKGLLQDYQKGMDYIAGLSEQAQGLDFVLPFMGGGLYLSRAPRTQGSLRGLFRAQSRLTKNASKLASLNPRSGEWAAEQVAEAKQDIAKTRQELKR